MDLDERFGVSRMMQLLERSYGSSLPPRVITTLKLAVDGHRGQLRLSPSKSSIPFIVHPVGVAILAIEHHPLVSEFVDDKDTVVCAALAHDLVEDTRVSADDVEQVAGRIVRSYVEALTKPQSDAIEYSSEERAATVLEQVRASGPTAVFVKACDLMQNLSRPEETPRKLYTKLARKAEPYVELLSSGCLGPAFADAFTERIRKAQQVSQQQDRPAPPISSLAAAIEECVRISSSKVVEIHDIRDIMCRLTSATSCTMASRAASNDDSDSVTATVADGRGGTLRATLNYEGGARPDWVTEVVLRGFLQILMHRITVQEADRLADLGAAASRFGLTINVDDALKLGAVPGDLERLAEWQALCGAATSVVLTALEILGRQERAKLLMPSAVRYEARVKEARSIMGKFLRYPSLKWPRFELMGDIAGVRVVTALPDDMTVVDGYIRAGWLARSGVDLLDRTDYYSEPTSSGYRALHYSLAIRLGQRDQPIACELQLRTVFQDVWSRISHESVYGADRNRRRKLAPKLHRIGELLTECEGVAQDVVRGAGGQKTGETHRS